MSSTARDEDGIYGDPCGTLRVSLPRLAAQRSASSESQPFLSDSRSSTGSGAGARPRTAQRAALLGKQRAERWQHTL